MTEQFDPRSDVPTVLFLCIHNAGRSQMALGWFRHLAGERAIAWSGGSEPASEVNPVAIAAMAEVGIDITDEFPKPWTDEAVRAADVPHLASRVADGLYERLAAGNVRRVAVLHAEPEAGAPVMKQLIPFDYDRIERPAGRNRPLIQMPPLALLAELVTEYVFSELCEALMLGFAAENDARMQAMLRARSNVSHVIDDLKRGYHQARQEQMTAEILELSESF